MAVESVTPVPGVNSIITVGGTSVVAVNGGPNGGIITNPYTAEDQGLSEPEPLYVSPVNDASLNGNGTTWRLEPGQSWPLIPGQTTQTKVNANTAGHKFSVVSY